MAQIRKRVARALISGAEGVAVTAFLVGVVAWRVGPMVLNYLRAP